MGIFNNFSRRKKIIMFRNWLSKKMDPTFEPMSIEQEKAFKITKKLILDSSSFLYADLSKERFIIVNEPRFIRMTNDKLRIIDGTFKYDIAFNPRYLMPLKDLFSRQLEHRHDKIESEIGARVEKSLSHILDEIEKESKQGEEK